MKLQTGDLLIPTSGIPILVIDISKISGLVKGFRGNKTVIENIGYERYIVEHLTFGRWRHFPVVK
jgi:hypothetical protein